MSGSPLRVDALRRPGALGGVAVIVLALASARCGDVNAALRQELEARQLSADLHLQFTKAADAAGRAVLADTDEASVGFATEARRARDAVQKDIDALAPLLDGLRFTNEAKLLKDFVERFAAYKAADDTILDLAVENTNLKAQRLSFGPGQEAADAFRDALEAVVASAPGNARVEALAATALASLREIQVLQAPHIADPDDAVMTRLESRMKTAETAVRSALDSLGRVAPGGATRLATARTALDRFLDVNAQIIPLSRRNTNVRSLALSLEQKRTLIPACDQVLRALQDAMAKHGYPAGR